MSDQYLKFITQMDSDTLDRLMEQYGQDVWNYAYFITKNRSASDDITQEVFFQAYRFSTSFRGEATIKTWLLKITRNMSHNYLQTAFIQKVLLVDVVSPKVSSRSAEEVFFEQEASNDVWKKVFLLPRRLREVLVLVAKYQLTHSEIAQILKIPEGTVKSRLFAARKKMDRLLTEEEVFNGSI